jgi:probable rRNA maturation factor
MAVPISLRVETPGWRRVLPATARHVRAAARAALSAAEAGKLPGAGGGICLVLADDRLQQRLNREFRGRDKPTNVLSFDGSPAALGDVVLALETVAAEARAQRKTLADHVAHLVVHGVLHLTGHDHETGAEARRMERLEVEILARLGIADPYRLPARRRSMDATPARRKPAARRR